METTRYIGIDLHRNQFTCCVRLDNGRHRTANRQYSVERVIGNIHDFADEGKLAAYFGIVPRVSNSNETERSGRITKRGSKLGRTSLVQCDLVAQRYSPYLKTYYEKRRRGAEPARRSSL